MISASLSRAWPAWVVLAVAVTWLWPWASSPVPAVPALLGTWAVTALLWLWVRQHHPLDDDHASPASAPLLLGLIVAFAAWRMPVLDLALLGGLAGSLMCMTVAARCVRTCGAPLCEAICWGLVMAASLSSLLGLWQYLGLLRTPDATWTLLHASPHEEAFGQLRQRNLFGSLMSLGLAAWLYLSHTGWPRRSAHGLAWCSLVLLALGAAASSSRTAALTWLALCLLALWRLRPALQDGEGVGPRLGALVALVTFLIFNGLLPWLAKFLDTTTQPKISAFERLATQTEGAGVCESRIVLWRHVWELAWQRPWLGWGWGELDYAHATQAVASERFCAQLGHAHHLLLHLAVEWGLPLTILASLAALVWVYRHPPWRAAQPVQVLGWAWLLVIGLHSNLEFPLWYGPFQLVCGFALGAVVQRAPPSSQSSAPARRHFASVLVGAWLACTLWAVWDYHRVSQVFLSPSERSPGCRQAPADCLAGVVWFHQARDYALLQQAKGTAGQARGGELAQRVAHFAPEPWVLSFLRSEGPTLQNGQSPPP